MFYEDNVATLGGAVALIAIAISHITGNYIYDGIGTMIIGILLIGIAIKIGYDNTIGLIGVAAPKKIETSVAQIILNDPKVVDIQKMRILQEGGDYHVEAYLELEKGMTLADADDVKFRVAEKILDQSYIDDVFLGIIESDDKQTWTDITLDKDNK